ncbi:hypothetical protein [Microvirga tunisiensis]|uniref:hypothetical protein n=1 Tax=Microvirga tunisiensis TaxID=2108360 RepID=UPI00129CE015|nr:hypothetical protein [Microvirga tunisiensis]
MVTRLEPEQFIERLLQEVQIQHRRTLIEASEGLYSPVTADDFITRQDVERISQGGDG